MKKKLVIFSIGCVVCLIAVTLLHAWFGRTTIQNSPAIRTGETPESNLPPPSLISPAEIVDSGVPKNAIPSLDDPQFVGAPQALQELHASGMGLVVVKGSVARFYPYQILTWHEVVNDVVAGTPMAITYCALCNVGVVYDRTVQGKELSFGVSGKLHGLDSLLYDRTTDSLWSQVTGESVSGKMSGQKLTQIAAPAMTLKEFSTQYPTGQVLSKFTGFVRNYDDLSYGDYAASAGGEAAITSKGLWHPKTNIVGIEVGGKFKAYPEDAIEKKTITDTFAGQRLRIGIGDGKVVVSNITDPRHTTYITHYSMYWFMWQLWHADTEIYKL